MSHEIKTEWVNLTVNGQSMPTYVASPEAPGTYPAVMVFMEIFGVNEHIQDVTQRLAKEGYVVVAPNYFYRQCADLNNGYNADTMAQGMGYLNQHLQEWMYDDAQALIDYLNGHDQVARKGHYGAMGFCFGGHVAYVVATMPQVAATASFYGGGVANGIATDEEPPADKSEDIKGRMLCLFGDKDSLISQVDIQLIESSLERAHVNHQVIVYPGVEHGFFCDKRGSYNPEAAFDAWHQVKQLFQESLKEAASVAG